MKKNRWKKPLLTFIAAGLFSCVGLLTLLYFSNQNLPEISTRTDDLDPVDKTRLEETLHLKSELGASIWPGWDKMAIPMLLWNRQNSYLFEFENPPETWEKVESQSFRGNPYYRNPDFEPENFAMLIGDVWGASIATKDEADLFLREVFQDLLPPPFNQFIPYKLLIQPSEVQISAALHESFHVYQAIKSPANFENAENIYPDGARYWAVDEAMRGQWKDEIDQLIKAVNAASDSEAANFTEAFLTQRDQRRASMSLDESLINYERRFEWLEGLAKYVELAIWEQASTASGYIPISGMMNDPDFEGYSTFQGQWNREIQQAKSQANQESDVRFYYTGMLQARILDRLMPGWKTHILEPDVFLEDLLRAAIQP